MIDSNVTLNFQGGIFVQIVVIYEVREKATSIFVPHIYYHVRGMYQLVVSNN
jgi:hypothetical protein